ncbi:MAG: 4-hydroxy-tetrahydrodipicolinate synthase [Burkholderiales bacterium]|nr:4-hydroxy-tetrahydrodipicolinate synthase [Burkholderiales bacterium]
MRFSGSIPALITPFRGEDVDYAAFARLVEWHIDEGSDGLVIAGTTGEAPTLTDDELHRCIALAVDVARFRIPIIAGASSNCTREAIVRTALARDAGADAVLHAAGYYNKPTQAQVIGHFQRVDAASALPILVYNVPSRTGIEFSTDTIVALAELPKVQGIKDATGNVGRLSEQRLRITKPFDYLSGDDATALGYLAHGGAGCISVTANVVPRLYAAFIRAGVEGDFRRARELNEKMATLHAALFFESSPGGAKYALSRLGMSEDSLRLPMTSVSEAARARIDAALACATA